MNIYNIRELYAYADGDCITPTMGVSIDAGYALAQYWNTTEGKIVNTDFSVHNAKLYPQGYSSLEGKVVVPESGTWHIGSPSSNALTFDASGKCTTSGYTSKFKLSTIVVNSVTLPCLVICGNLASATDLTTKHIYFVGHYNGLQFTCHQEITVQIAMADAYDIIVSVEGNSGSGDTVIDNDTDYVQMSPYLIRGGVNVAGATYKWEKLTEGAWKAITHTAGLTEISGNGVLKVFEAAVEGLEYFRVTATLGTTVVRKVVDISDTHDTYYLDDGCSTSAGVKTGETVTFNPKVYLRKPNVPDTNHNWKFAFTVINGKTGDVLMTANTSLRLTYDTIKGHGSSIKVQTRAYW